MPAHRTMGLSVVLAGYPLPTHADNCSKSYAMSFLRRRESRISYSEEDGVSDMAANRLYRGRTSGVAPPPARHGVSLRTRFPGPGLGALRGRAPKTPGRTGTPRQRRASPWPRKADQTRSGHAPGHPVQNRRPAGRPCPAEETRRLFGPYHLFESGYIIFFYANPTWYRPLKLSHCHSRLDQESSIS